MDTWHTHWTTQHYTTLHSKTVYYTLFPAHYTTLTKALAVCTQVTQAFIIYHKMIQGFLFIAMRGRWRSVCDQELGHIALLLTTR